MFGLMSRAELDEEEEEREEGGSSGIGAGLAKIAGFLILLVIGLILLPAALIAGMFHLFLSRGRLRPSVVACIGLLFVAVGVIGWRVSDSTEALKTVFGDALSIADQWTLLIPPAIFVNLIVGALAGVCAVAWSAHVLKTTPHLRKLEGSWMYDFQYRRTPREYWVLKHRQKALRTKDLQDSEKEPLGINLEDDELAYRYYNEANKQTIVTGGVGSGKALAEDVLLPTPSGFRQVGDLNPGDTLFDADGHETKIVARFEPDTPDKYRLKISGGIEVESCGDHLWPVSLIGLSGVDDETRTITLNTREIAEAAGSADVRFEILRNALELPESPLDDFARVGRESYELPSITRDHLLASRGQRIDLLRAALTAAGDRLADGLVFRSIIEEQIKRLQQIVGSLGIRTTEVFEHSGEYSFASDLIPSVSHLAPTMDDPEGEYSRSDVLLESIERIDSDKRFFCFTVDSPSHLFLCTESYLVTHNTVSILNMILSDIKNGINVVMVDFKRDPALAARLAAWAARYDRPFYHFTSGKPEDYSNPHNPRGQAQYDALHSSSPAVRADMVLGMREYDSASAVYKNNMQQLLQVLFSAIDEADRSKAPDIEWDSGGIHQIASSIEGDHLTDLAIACEGTRIEKQILAISEASKGKTQIKHALEELQGQMRTMIASQYGRWMRTDSSSLNIDLFELTSSDKAPVVLFSIDSDAEQEFSGYLGSLIMADITNVSARRRNAKLKNQVTVYIDEFQAVPPSSVRSLLEKSRASKLAMTLSVQSFEQIINAAPSNGESVLKGILDTCGNFLIHSGAIYPSALRLSEIQGQHEVTTYSASSRRENFFGSLNWANRRNQIVQTRVDEEWITPPSKFMELSSPSESNGFKATAMFLTKATEDKRYKVRGALARQIQVIPNDEVLDEDLIEGEIVSESDDVDEMESSDDELTTSPKTDDFDSDEPDFDEVPKKKEPIVENSVGHDPDWTTEDPNKGTSDFHWESDSKTPAQDDGLEEAPRRAKLIEDDPFSDDFTPKTLNSVKPSSPSKPKAQPAKEAKPSADTEEPPAKSKPLAKGQLPDLEDF